MAVARRMFASTAPAGHTVVQVALLLLPNSSACCDIAQLSDLASHSSCTWRLALSRGWRLAGRLVEVGLEVEVRVASAAAARILLLLVP